MATTVRVDVSREVLEWALDRSGKRPHLERQLPMLRRWLDGEVKPTLRQLEALAKRVHVPLGVLFLAHPPVEELSITNYRTHGDDLIGEPSRDLLDTVRMMERRQAWLREYLMESGYEPKSFVGSASIFDDATNIAASIRSVLGLPNDWAERVRTWEEALRIILRSIEHAGIMVVRSGVVGNSTSRTLDVMEFRGFVLVDEYAPLIFLNGNDSKAAQMFTLAHELAHIWLGSSAVFDLAYLQPADSDMEQACNRIAAEFLVPSDALESQLPRSLEHRDHDTVFQHLARRFKVSPLVIARRVLDMGLLSRREYRVYYRHYLERLRQLEESGRDDDSGPYFYEIQRFRVSRLFLTNVVAALKEGRLLYREAYSLTGLRGDTFAALVARELGGLAP